MTLSSRSSLGVALVWITCVALIACGSTEAETGSSAGAGTSVGGSSGASAASGNASGASANGGNAGRPSGGSTSGSGGSTSGGSTSGGSTSGEGGAAGETPARCGTIATFEGGKSPAAVIHVATNGDDTTGNGSSQLPFASISRAAREALPGTAIRVHAGTYAGDSYIEELAGTQAAPIWIGGAPGETRPILAGGGQALHLVRARWIIVHDLEIQGQTANGINADDGGDRENNQASHALIFRNLSIHDVGSAGNQDCLKLSGINAFFVLDSEFARCGGGSSGSAIDHVGCHDGLIARNEFAELSGGNAVQCKGGSRNIEIRWNLIQNGGQRAINLGGSTGFEFFRPPLSTSEPNAEAQDIRVVANVIRGGVAALGFVGCVDCLAANNTLIDPENWVLRILQETTTSGQNAFYPTQSGRFINNLIYFARSDISATINVGPNTDSATFVFRNNLWFAHDDSSRSSPTDLPAPETNAIYGEDPELSAPSAGDFSIGLTSPAIGAGTTLSEVTGDIVGNCYADPPSIGAFEAL